MVWLRHSYYTNIVKIGWMELPVQVDFIMRIYITNTIYIVKYYLKPKEYWSGFT